MLQHFDTAQLAVKAWKNGGGSTREIVCSPVGADIEHFVWRVSIATIEQSGPFSIFEGVDRIIMLVNGQGVHLKSLHAIDHRLDQTGVPFAFPGEAVIDCTLLGEASTDFNVMTQRGRVRAEVSVLRDATPLPPSPRGLLWAMQGTWDMMGWSTCTEGQGWWWDGSVHAGMVTPKEAHSALVWVHLIEEA